MHQSQGRRILVVDDERSVADTLAIIFRNAGYDAVATYDGKTALAACETRTPDLLLSDVQMPGVNGIELAILVQELCPNCGILLFSGLGGSFDLVAEAARQGFRFEILQKPTPPAELLRKIAGTLRRGSLALCPPRAAGAQTDLLSEAI